MSQIRFPALALLMMASAIMLLACAVPVAPIAPSAAVPTSAAPTTVPVSAPTTVPPTTAPTAASAAVDAGEIVTTALEKFAAAQSFRLRAHTELSSLFFQGEYTPMPGQDPDLVSLFNLEGQQSGSDLHYALSGFLASFIGLFSGFDPNINEIEIAEVDGTRYMFGNLENETEPQWYILSDEPGSSTFAPQEMVLPMIETDYPTGAFTGTGTEAIGSQTCDVFTGSRAAFDAVFPNLVSEMLLDQETLDLDSIDRAEFTVTVCPDGNVHHIRFNFDAHSKLNADDKGTLAFEIEISDQNGDISITAPTGAVPMPASVFGAETPEPDATPTTAITTVFDTLNGEWEGLNGEDSPLSFTVEDGAVTFLNLNYAVTTGGCSASGLIANSVDNGEIEDNQFSAQLTGDDVTYTLQGQFDSNNRASGTLSIKGNTFCGETDEQVEWTAQHISSPDAAESAQPTVESTTAPTRASPTQTPTLAPTRTPTRAPTTPPTAAPATVAPAATVDGVKMITDAFAAFAARDLNGALANVSDDVAFNLGGTAGVGKAALQSNMQLALTFGAGFSVSNVQQVGDIVTFTTTVTGIRPGVYPNSTAVIEDGKITVFNIN